MRLALVIELLVTVGLTACYGDIAVRDECEVGMVEGCFCDGLTAGTRTCSQDTTWGECECDEVDLGFDVPDDAPSGDDLPHDGLEHDGAAEDTDASDDPDLDVTPDEPMACSEADDCGESGYCGPDDMCHDGSTGDPCSESAQCASQAPICDESSNLCRPRRENDPCGTGCPAGLFCVDGICYNGSAGRPCNDGDDCVGDSPHCEEQADVCVECLDSTHCDGDSNEPICDSGTHVCRRCNGAIDDDACAVHAATACVTSGTRSGACGACDPARFGAFCSGSSPICDLESATCRPCDADSDDCDPEGSTGLLCLRDESDADGTCQSCLPNGDEGCSGLLCDPDNYVCVECLSADDCDDEDVCTNNSCGSCDSDGECGANPSGGQCVDGGCRECDPADDAGCSGGTPVCHPTSLTCVACVGDGDCPGCNTCISNVCSPQTAANGNGCNDECTYCESGVCAARGTGDNVECAACHACIVGTSVCVAQTADDGHACNTDCTQCDNGDCDVRPNNATTECGACHACAGGAGDCQPQNANDGHLCNEDCTRCQSGSCVDRSGNDGTECTSCHTCGPSGGACLQQHGSNGNGCDSQCSHCDLGICRTRADDDSTECPTCSACSAGVCVGTSGPSGKNCNSSSTYCCAGSCVDPVGMLSEYNSACGTGDCAGGTWGCSGTSARCDSYGDPCDYCNMDGRPVDAACTENDGAACATGTIIAFCGTYCNTCIDFGTTASCEDVPCGIDDCPDAGDVCDGQGVCRTGPGGSCSVAINCASRICSQQVCAACPF